MSTPSINSEDLQYFISEKNSTLVVSFAGRLNRKTEAIVEKCKDEVVSRRPKFVVLYLKDLGNRVEINALPALVRLQKSIRELPAKLSLCALNVELRNLLEEKGLIRHAEVSPTLQEALKDKV